MVNFRHGWCWCIKGNNGCKRKSSSTKQVIINSDEQPSWSFSKRSNTHTPCTDFSHSATKKSKLLPRKENIFTKDDFVLFEYEEEIFPGQVDLVKDTGCEIRSLKKSGLNWKWPQEEIKRFYLNKDIKEKINPPKQPLNQHV